MSDPEIGWMRERRPLLVLGCVAALAGCGGGGKKATTSVTTATPGTTSTSATTTLPVVTPQRVDIPVPADLPETARARFVAGRTVAEQSGCLACHRIAGQGGELGADLSNAGRRLSGAAIRRALVDPEAPMPDYRALPDDKLDDLVFFLSELDTTPQPSGTTAGTPCPDDADCG